MSKNKHIIIIAVLLSISITSPVIASLSGSYNVGVGQTFTTITDALKAWKDSTITGDVTLRLMDVNYPSETFPLVCTIPALYSGGDWNLTIKPVSQCSIIGNNSTALVNIKSINRLTIDGSASDTSKDLVIYNTSIASGPSTIRLINGASYNTIKNCIIKGQGNFGHALSIYTSATGSASGNSENLIEHCDITRGQDTVLYNSVYVTASSSGYQNMNNTIRHCNIYDFYMAGVTVGSYSPNTTITECNIYSTFPQLSSYMYGIYTFGSGQGLIATRNRIGAFMPYYPGGTSSQLGMYLTATLTTDTNTIANNFIYLNSTASPDNNNIYGIGVGAPVNTNYNIFYNSIYIAGTAASGLSAGIARNRANMIIKNNIVFNNRPGGSGASYCIFDSTGVQGVISDYNDLYVPTPGNNSQYVGYQNGTNFDSLVSWQNATNLDSNSINLPPDFKSITDLHIDSTSLNVNNKAIPLAEVMIDIDSQLRDPNFPDIGADEYTPYNPHSIYASAIGSGTIIPSGVIIVNDGDDTTFIITPDIGHHLDSLIVDNVNYSGDSISYQFVNVTTDHIITAYFSINTYIITATATSGGTITPSGIITINYGDDTTFTIAANTNYVLDSVLVDGASVGAVTSYPFTDVTANHTIHAMFSMTAIPGWTQQESMPTQVAGKYVKDGGTIVAVTGIKDADVLYAFRGKSRELYKYDGSWTWLQNDSIPNGVKVTNPLKINKKVVAKGASMCFDRGHTIYATKGNGVPEFWSYDLLADSNRWTAKAFVPVPKGLKGGTSIIWFHGKVYLLAGNQKKTDPNNFFAYTPEADTSLGTPWIPLASLVLGPKTKVWKDGACITEVNGVIYAMKSNDKPNYFFSYDTGTNTWTQLTNDSIPPFDSLLTNGVGKLKKVYVKDGAAMVNDGSVIYATKGSGYNFMWKYTPGVGWTRSDSAPRLYKKSVIKTGGAMTYANGAVWLLKGNNTPEFWKYVPTDMSKVKSQMSKVIQSVNTQSTIPHLQSKINISPNPFTKLTTIQYTVPISGNVTIKLFNTNGRLIEILNDGYLNAGTYTTNLSTNPLAKGIYFLRYETANNRTELKLIVQ
jgi:hypothetical protein